MKNKSEHQVQKQLAIDFSNSGLGKLWIFDSGMAYHKVGKNYIPFSYGPGKGFADLMGFTKVKITPEMVGKELAVFSTFEVKTPKQYPKPHQKAFAKMVDENYGISSERVVNFDDIVETITKKLKQ